MEQWFIDTLPEIKNSLANLAQEYGEQTVDLALLVVQLESLGQVIGWLTLLIVTIITTVLCFNRVKGGRFQKQFDKAEAVPVFLTVLLGGCGFVMSAGVLANVPSIITIASAIGYPEIKIAHSVINTVLN